MRPQATRLEELAGTKLLPSRHLDDARSQMAGATDGGWPNSG